MEAVKLDGWDDGEDMGELGEDGECDQITCVKL